jgi:hypothetical protein
MGIGNDMKKQPMKKKILAQISRYARRAKNGGLILQGTNKILGGTYEQAKERMKESDDLTAKYLFAMSTIAGIEIEDIRVTYKIRENGF